MEDKIIVIYNGVSNDFFKIKDLANNKPNYLVFIGSREPYKNFNFAVMLLSELKDFELVIVGKPLDNKEYNFISSKLGNRFKVHSNINNHSLNEIYNSAYALLYPSTYEGFGIPILEAMKSGTPFIALNKSSIPEVAGDAGILLEELNIDDFKVALDKISKERNIIIAKGYKQAEKFSWEKCYQETLKVYQDLYH